MPAPFDIVMQMAGDVPTLLEAIVNLYPQAANGTAVVGSPVWPWCQAEGLRIGKRPVSVVTRTAGYAAERRVTLRSSFAIAIQRVWVAPQNLATQDDVPDGQLVLDIVWVDSDSGRWRRRTFYGVTLDASDSDAQSKMEFQEGFQFTAESEVPDSGTGAVPSI